MKTNLLQKVKGQIPAMAVVAVVLMAAGEARAANFTANHNASGANLSDWEVVSGQWSVNTTNGGVNAGGNNVSKQLLIHKNNLTNDGTFTVVLKRGDNNALDGGGGGIVFRYKSQTEFYNVKFNISPPGWGGTGIIHFHRSPSTFNSTVPTANADKINLTATQVTALGPDPTYTVIIKLTGSKFEIFNKNSEKLGEFNDAAITEGRVGYGYGNSNYAYATFVSSSWTDATPPGASVPTGYDGYYVWNTATAQTFTGGSGAWATSGTGADNWSNNNSGTRVNWPSAATSALFHTAGTGNVVTVNGSVNVNNIHFNATGYTVSDGTNITLSVTDATQGDTISVSNGNTATINAVISGGGVGQQRALVKAGAGTLILSGANTFYGSTRVNDGTLRVTNLAAFGNAANSITNNATLDISASGTLDRAITSGSTSGTLIKSGNSELTFGTGAKNISTLNVTAGTLTVGATTGANAVTVSNSFNLSNGATLKVNAGTSLGSPSTITFGSGSSNTASLNITGTLEAEQTYTLFGGGTVSGYFNTVSVNGTPLTKTGTGATATWAHGVNTVSVTYTGGVKIVVKKPAITLTVVANPTNGGTVTGTNNDVTVNTHYPITATANAGYDFTGWTADPAANASIVDATAQGTSTGVTLTASATVTANFKLKGATGAYTITFDPNGGDVTPTSGTTTNGKLASLPTPTRADYTFTGWFTAATGGTEVSLDYTFDKATTIYAQWTEGSDGGAYIITFNGNGGIPANSTLTTVNGRLQALPTDPTRSGYKFDGWFTSATGGTAVTTATPFSGHTTVYAQWTEDNEPPPPPPPEDTTFTLSYSVSPSTAGSISSVTPVAEDDKYKANTEVTLTLGTGGDNKYVFSHWEVNSQNKGSGNTVKVVMSSDMTVTAVFELVSVDTLISITSAEYVDASMTFSVKLKLETGLSAGTDYYVYRLMRGADTVAFTDKSVPISGNKGDTKTITETIDSVVFNAKYTFYIVIVNTDGVNTSRVVSAEIEVGDFKEQKITGVGSAPTAARSAAYADNGNFRLDVEGWKNGSNNNQKSVVFDVTVSAAEATAGTDFIRLSKDYKFKVGANIQGGNLVTFTVPFVVSIALDKGALDAAPSGYVADDAKLYRYESGGWHVVFDSKYDAATGYVSGNGKTIVRDDTSSYRLMINTTTPTLKIGASSNAKTLLDGKFRKGGLFTSVSGGAIQPGDDKITVEKIDIQTNVANTSVRALIGAAVEGGGLTLDTAAFIPPLKFTGGGYNGDMEILANKVDKGNIDGVLVYLIVDNGGVSDTINMSRQVKLQKTYTVESAAGGEYHRKWSPFYAKVNLVDTTIENVFRAALFNAEELEGETGLPLDDKRWRLFRYLPTAKEAAGNGWVEYRDDTQDKKYFNAVNGRLMWLRTDRNAKFEFTAAQTVALSTSLTDTFTVRDTLAGKQWSDVVAPFGFKVRVKDILLATLGAEKSDSLHFFAWDGRSGNFAAKRLYVWSTDNADTTLDGPFTVYNNTNRKVALKIPPKPAFLYKGLGKKREPLAKSAADGGVWYYEINAATDDAPDLASLRIGYSETERIAPAPPTLGVRSAAVVSEDGWHIGDYLTPELLSRGRTFKLRFTNGDRQKAVFRFAATASAGVPGQMQLMFIDAATGAILGGGGSERAITVAGNSHADVYAVAGSRDYLNKTAVGPSGAKFALGGVTVNQAARSVRVKYYVPLAGTDRVEMTVYNLKGRLLWKNAEKARQSSWNTMEWKSRESRGGAAAGLYIIRIRAVNVNGKTMAVESKKVTFSR